MAADQARDAALQGWCLLPVHTARGRMLWPVGRGAVLAPGSWTESVQSALLAVGCCVWAEDVAPNPGGLLPATAAGVLHCLDCLDGVDGGAWDNVSTLQRDQLRAFLLQVCCFYK